MASKVKAAVKDKKEEAVPEKDAPDTPVLGDLWEDGTRFSVRNAAQPEPWDGLRFFAHETALVRGLSLGYPLGGRLATRLGAWRRL